MKANDLKIGNLVIVENEKYRPDLKNTFFFVTGINPTIGLEREPTYSVSLDFLDKVPYRFYEKPSQFIEYIKPLPITKEWLLKLGFECIADDVDQKRYALKNRKESYFYAVYLDHEELCLEKRNIQGYETIIWDEKHFQYMHQLQNIWSSLIGEELVFSSTEP